MAENLYCEAENCGQIARVFGFVSGNKLKTCEAHVITLINKKATVYDIAATHFIESPKDSPFYEERRELMQRELGNLVSLETLCENDWSAWQRQLQDSSNSVFDTIQRCFQEMWLVGQQHYQEAKRNISEMRNRVEQLVLDKGFQLDSEELTRCHLAKGAFLFRVIAGDCRLHVAAELMKSFHALVWDIKKETCADFAQNIRKLAQEQANERRKDVAMEIAGYAKQLGAQGADYTYDARQQSLEMDQRLQSLFPVMAAYDAGERFKAGVAASKLGDFDTALRELQRGIGLLQGSDHLQLSLDISNAISEIYSQTGRWQDTVSQCQVTLSYWPRSPEDNYAYFQALYYHINALFQMNKLDIGFTAVEEWTKKLIANSTRCQSLLLRIRARKLCVQSRENEGVLLYEEAFQIDQSPSYSTICSRYEIADIYQQLNRNTEAEQAFLCACDLYSAHYPYSIHYAMCRKDLGTFYKDVMKPAEAELQYKQAIQLYSARYSDTESHAKCIYNLGLLLEQSGRTAEAVLQFQTAKQIFDIAGSSHFASYCGRSLQRLEA